MNGEIRLQEFDRNDPANFGRPLFFDLDQWLSLAEQYIMADEVERALWVLDNPPAWYRDHYPVIAKKMRDKLLTQFFTSTDYSKDPVADEQIGKCDHDVPRAQLVIDYVEKHNAKKIYPTIFECAPGNYWLPFVLKSKGLGFGYYGEHLDPTVQSRARSKLGHEWSGTTRGHKDDHNVFVCFEMLEHLHNPVEIYQSYLKTCGDGDCKTIFLSTPKYTFGGGMPDWQTNPLGHLRAYTPREFHQFALKYWPEFKWTMYDGHVMCLVGERA